VILVVILVKCTGPQKDQKETQNGTQGVTQTTEYQEIGKLQNIRKLKLYAEYMLLMMRFPFPSLST
jgi:hypothetical protein